MAFSLIHCRIMPMVRDPPPDISPWPPIESPYAIDARKMSRCGMIWKPPWSLALIRRWLFMQSRACPPSSPSVAVSANGVRDVPRAGGCSGSTHQSLSGSVKSMPVVPAELGVGSVEGRVTGSLRLLDTAVGIKLATISSSC